MIQITVFQDENRNCLGFQTEGHAGFDDPGHDIVCAAASMLVINTINAIELLTEDEFGIYTNDEEGIISVDFDELPSADASLLLKAMILGLESMVSDENYTDYIDLTFEEVQKP